VDRQSIAKEPKNNKISENEVMKWVKSLVRAKQRSPAKLAKSAKWELNGPAACAEDLQELLPTARTVTESGKQWCPDYAAFVGQNEKAETQSNPRERNLSQGGCIIDPSNPDDIEAFLTIFGGRF
jgi:hypothetical protein